MRGREYNTPKDIVQSVSVSIEFVHYAAASRLRGGSDECNKLSCLVCR